MDEREIDGLTRRTLLRLGLLTASVAASPSLIPRPTSAQDTKLGTNLIGKLEGPEVITDPTKFP